MHQIEHMYKYYVMMMMPEGNGTFACIVYGTSAALNRIISTLRIHIRFLRERKRDGGLASVQCTRMFANANVCCLPVESTSRYYKRNV